MAGDGTSFGGATLQIRAVNEAACAPLNGPLIAFNYFNTSIRVLHTEMDNFSADFLNIVKRHLR